MNQRNYVYQGRQVTIFGGGNPSAPFNMPPPYQGQMPVPVNPLFHQQQQQNQLNSYAQIPPQQSQPPMTSSTQAWDYHTQQMQSFIRPMYQHAPENRLTIGEINYLTAMAPPEYRNCPEVLSKFLKATEEAKMLRPLSLEGNFLTEIEFPPFGQIGGSRSSFSPSPSSMSSFKDSPQPGYTNRHQDWHGPKPTRGVPTQVVYSFPPDVDDADLRRNRGSSRSGRSSANRYANSRYNPVVERNGIGLMKPEHMKKASVAQPIATTDKPRELSKMPVVQPSSTKAQEISKPEEPEPIASSSKNARIPQLDWAHEAEVSASLNEECDLGKRIEIALKNKSSFFVNNSQMPQDLLRSISKEELKLWSKDKRLEARQDTVSAESQGVYLHPFARRSHQHAFKPNQHESKPDQPRARNAHQRYSRDSPRSNIPFRRNEPRAAFQSAYNRRRPV